MVEGYKTLLVKGIAEKQPEVYKKKYCHPHMHPKNYFNRMVLRKNEEFVAKLEAGDEAAMEELKELIAEEGLSGEFIVKTCGGPGPKRDGESKKQYHERIVAEKLGQHEIARVEVD